MIVRAIKFVSLVIVLSALLSCPFEADRKILEDRNTIDITVKLGTSTVYHGYGFFIGVVNPGETKDIAFTIENTGYGGNVELLGDPPVSISGDGFIILIQPESTSIAPGGQTGFSIRFAPTEYKFYEGIVAIPNNDPGEEDYSFALLSENYDLPAAPAVTGAAETNDTKPSWSWTGGGNGSGTFRYRLDSQELYTDSTETTDTTFTPADPIPPGNHTLYVQEKATAGEFWSLCGSYTTKIRLNPPDVTGTTTTADTTPTWTWTTGGDGNGTFRYKLDSGDLETGATITTDTSFTPASPIPPAYHRLYVQEQDIHATYWSSSDSFQINVWIRAPNVSGASPTTDTMPTWTWTSSGDGNGTFRYKLDSSDLTTGATITTDTSFTPAEPIPPGSHYLYVQEQEVSGTYWSSTGSRGISIQLIPPAVSGVDATSETRPTWTWTTGGGNGYYRYMVDSDDFTSGSTETTGTEYTPEDPFPDGNHTLYVQEMDANGAFWSPSGIFTISIRIMSAVGWIGGGSDGWKTASGASSGNGYQNFNRPCGICIDTSGNIYVADSINHRVSKWDSDGNAIGWIGGGSNGWKTTTVALSGDGYQSFYNPYGIFVDASGNIYVAEYSNHRVSKWDSEGNAVGWIGGGSSGWKTTSGDSSGYGYQGLYYPSGVFVDSTGDIFVADTYNNRICKWHQY
jgi:hypothetical protein